MLIDAYAKTDSVVLWKRSGGEDVREVHTYSDVVYTGTGARRYLDAQGVQYTETVKETVMDGEITVLAVPVPENRQKWSFVQFLEKTTRYRVPLYNADVNPAQLYMFEEGLVPFAGEPDLDVMHMRVVPSGIEDGPVDRIRCGEQFFEGEEEELLQRFAAFFEQRDPDVIAVPHAFRRVPYLIHRLQLFGIDVAFHRWDRQPIEYRGGDSFYSYGEVRYSDFAVRLHGRLLIDTTSMMGEECGVDAMVEICRLTGSRLQHVASRSFGAAFQKSLVREMITRDYVVPYKEKPIDEPLSMAQRVKADSGGLSLDPMVGFHQDVAEIDFSSMFPQIIRNKNISAETVVSEEGPLEQAPGIPVSTSWRERGIVAACLEPLLEQRREYKEDPTPRNKRRAEGLKWILVTCYGYLRFREFKLGLASSHMAICAYARDKLLQAKGIAERNEFTVVHGIVDSLYVKQDGISRGDAEQLCDAIERETGIPIGCDGIYEWITFLPSIRDRERPTPTKHYGIYATGDVKARGIMLRRGSTPRLVERFQRQTIQDLATCSSPEEIVDRVPQHCRRIRDIVASLDERDVADLVVEMKISTIEYDKEVPQQQVVDALQRRGADVRPGMTIAFVYARDGAVLPDEYQGRPDVAEYRRQLARSLYELVQPYGVAEEVVEELCKEERQARL